MKIVYRVYQIVDHRIQDTSNQKDFSGDILVFVAGKETELEAMKIVEELLDKNPLEDYIIHKVYKKV